MVFYWAPAADSDKQELFASGNKIGLWDPASEVYQRVNMDGTLSGPVTPPWKLAGLEEESCAITPKAPEAAPKVEEVARAESWQEQLLNAPPWLAYAIGGMVTLMITGVGMMMQIKRPAPV